MAGLWIEGVDLDLLAWPPGRGDGGMILISVQGSDGCVGYGEAAAGPGCLDRLHALASFLPGRDAFRLTAMHDSWSERQEPARGRTAALTGAIEAALLDLQARHAGVPLCRYLGGRYTDRVPLAGHLGGGPDPAALAEQAAGLVRDRGCRALTVESAGDDGDDGARLAALRRALGPDIGLRLDLMASPVVVQAQAVLARVDACFPEFVIDPSDSLAGLARLRRLAGAAIAAGRGAPDPEGLARAIGGDALDVWVADALDCGGPAAFLRGVALCRTFAVDIALCARGRSEIGAALALHLAATHRVANRAVELAPEVFGGVLAGGLQVCDGHALLPHGDGLGVTPDPDRVAALRVGRITVAGGAGAGQGRVPA